MYHGYMYMYQSCSLALYDKVMRWDFVAVLNFELAGALANNMTEHEVQDEVFQKHLTVTQFLDVRRKAS